MQENDRVTLARKIAAAVFDMAERDKGLSNPRLLEMIEAILTEKVSEPRLVVGPDMSAKEVWARWDEGQSVGVPFGKNVAEVKAVWDAVYPGEQKLVNVMMEVAARIAERRADPPVG